MTSNITERKNTRSPKHEGGGGGKRERETDKKGPKAQLLIKVPLGSHDTGSFSSCSAPVQLDVIFFLGVNPLEEGDRLNETKTV